MSKSADHVLQDSIETRMDAIIDYLDGKDSHGGKHLQTALARLIHDNPVRNYAELFHQAVRKLATAERSIGGTETPDNGLADAIIKAATSIQEKSGQRGLA